jgi:ribonuclease HI
MVCGEEDSWRHSLINCAMARSVWALSDEDITEHVSMNEDPSAKQWLFVMMETLSRDDFARVAVTLWAIWYARRRLIHEGECQSPLSTHLFIQRYLQDLSILARATPQKAAAPEVRHPKWIPPVEGCAKINVDAALAKTRPGGAVGAVCRSADGIYLGASSLTVEGITNPSVLEAMACREALALAQDLNLRRITVASDCLAVVQNLSRPFAGDYSAVLHEIKETSTLFERVLFRHENRASNTEAHRLARSVTTGNVGRQVWLLEPPDGLCINTYLYE